MKLQKVRTETKALVASEPISPTRFTKKSQTFTASKSNISNLVDLNMPSTSRDCLENIPETECPKSEQDDDNSDYYDYSRITAFRTPQPLDVIEAVELPRLSDLPEKYLRAVKIKNIPPTTEDESYDMEDEDIDDDYEEDFEVRINREAKIRNKKQETEMNELELYKTEYYFDSDAFMKFFQNHVFPNVIGKTLGFTEQQVAEALSITGVIYCAQNDDKDNVIDYEIIPAISIPKPTIIPLEWFERLRPEKVDKFNHIVYKWPTEAMKNTVAELGSVIIPKGFIQKRGENKDSVLEWEIGFPKVERYLESKMTHSQIKCFLFIITIFKTYIEPETQKNGITIEHIRKLIFYECENNYRDWPYHKLGVKMIKILRHFHDNLSARKLHDYFINERNLFENIPAKFLIKIQKRIHNIIQSPLMHFILTLRNLRYSNSMQYPKLDFQKLISIVLGESVNSVNPTLNKLIQEDRERTTQRRKTYTAEQQWKLRNYEQNKKKKEKEKENKKKEEGNNKPKNTIDSAILDVSV